MTSKQNSMDAVSSVYVGHVLCKLAKVRPGICPFGCHDNMFEKQMLTNKLTEEKQRNKYQIKTNIINNKYYFPLIHPIQIHAFNNLKTFCIYQILWLWNTGVLLSDIKTMKIRKMAAATKKKEDKKDK
ncbi:hypothetical protein SNE40_011728 [Patella caerulea]|uniref:Uncharacterized protein n=1 Tax=Patella caerulea TaxID=87958 RepID=A0AAN8JP84_PATCE